MTRGTLVVSGPASRFQRMLLNKADHLRQIEPSSKRFSPKLHAVTIAATNVGTANPPEEGPSAIRRSTWKDYLLAIAITILITLIRYSLDSVLTSHSVYTFYFASVILAAWYCGLGPSILNIALAVAIASYTFAEPRGSFRVDEFRHQVGLVAFSVISSYLAYLIYWLKKRRAPPGGETRQPEKTRGARQ